MPGKKDQGGGWMQVPVIIRADIVLKANEMNLDISTACNRALADLTGIDFLQERLTPLVTAHRSAHGAADAGTRSRVRVLHPVINADDPTAVEKLMKTKQPHEEKPVPETPVPDGSPRDVAHGPSPVIRPGRAAAKKGKTAEKERKRKDDSLKKFVTSKIVRVDSGTAVIAKDDMYQAFTRWCRDHRCFAAPEQKAFGTLLKNKFALTDKTVNGTPCWVNVQLK